MFVHAGILCYRCYLHGIFLYAARISLTLYVRHPHAAPMTTTSPHTAASRYLLVLSAGILIGLAVTVMGLRVMQARQDLFPRSLMQVMGRQLALLERARALHHCNAPDTQVPLRTLRLLGGELDTAFPELNDDSRFREHADALRAQVDMALATPPADCTALAQARQAIDEQCDACHRDFR
ncbi:conserved hypothetical protein [Xanthomonas albilineans GPE PC73]|uniref:Cytochrome c n=2 Tax=Xanthomonas albilineans TaxID=29447 RepID=D2U8D2_XANAP|nr:conserved hypothetical protein [Xanthomonas albilineans GPE PC73]